MNLTKKQLAIFQYIQDYQSQHDIAPTQREIKDAFQLKSYGSVQRYLKYLKDKGLIEQDWNSKRGIVLLKSEKSESTFEIDFYSIPLLGDVAAGNPIEAIEQSDEHIQLPPGIVPLKKSERYFALRVKGDSMIEAGILNGDVAIIKQTSSAQRGDKVVAIIEGEATLKTYFPTPQHIELRPENSMLEPIIVQRNQYFQIAGTLVGLMRSYQ